MLKTSLFSILSFGKYKGEVVDYIMSFDSEYIIFLSDKKIIDPDYELLNLIKQTKEINNNDYERTEDSFSIF